ncbi:MAG: thiamine pyrophosphate-dependent enzyme, partial [Chloroflexi bacterium]|nr:thiamine pyrophosphate-dependent enzyme [Chloroflexota bacterium]
SVVPVDVEVLADTAVALPMLLEECQRLIDHEDAERTARRERRRSELAVAHATARSTWARETSEAAGQTPIAPAWLAAEVWSIIREHDWVLTAGTLDGWAGRLWDFDQPYRHPGKSLGTATQIGQSLGVALAHREGQRLVVDLQPDGDLLFDAGALWVASAHRLPLLVVMYNNRAYFNDWDHQLHMATARGTPPENASRGVGIDRPAVDFAGMARSMGWYAEGPVERPEALRSAIAGAVRFVLSERRPALVDVVCAHR